MRKRERKSRKYTTQGKASDMASREVILTNENWGVLDAGPLRYRNDPSMFLNYGITNINLGVASFHDCAVPTRKWHICLGLCG